MKSLPHRYIKFVLYLTVAVLVNIAAMTLFFRIDLTQNHLYSLSKASKNVVSTLSEPLTVNVFFTRNLPAPHNSTERYLRDLLEEYAANGNRFFNYRFFDVNPEQDESGDARGNRELAESYGINPVQIQAVENDKVKFQKAYMGLVLIHGDLIEKIPTITTTEGLEYKMTTAIQKLNDKVSALLRLKDNVRVTLYMSKSLMDVAPFMQLEALPRFPEKISRVVASLNRRNYGKLTYEYKTPSDKSEMERLSKKYNLMLLEWPNLEEGNISAGSGIIGLVVAHGDKAKSIPIIRVMQLPLIGTHYEMADPEALEDTIGGGIETLIDINENIGYLADHGTASLFRDPRTSPQKETLTLSAFNSLLSRSYSIKNVTMAEGIPESIRCLIIARPTEKFSDYELFQIDQYLMQGKSLALFIDAFKEVPATGAQQMMGGGVSFVPLDTGLEKLLGHYGIHIRPAYVMDENCYRQRMPSQLGGGEQPIYFAPLIKNENINDNLAFMKNLKGLIGFKLAPVTVDAPKMKEIGISAHKLFSSSEKSWEMSERINLNPMFIRPPAAAEMQSFDSAYVFEGSFPSYFAGKPLPVKEKAKSRENEADQGDSPGESDSSNAEGTPEAPKIDLDRIERKGDFLEQGKPGKIFLMTSADMLGDTLIDPEGNGPNSVFVMNGIDYLNDRVDTAVMRAKQQRFNPLDDVSTAGKTTIKSIAIIGLPVCVVLFGLLVWAKRRIRKHQIEAMFQN